MCLSLNSIKSCQNICRNAKMEWKKCQEESFSLNGLNISLSLARHSKLSQCPKLVAQCRSTEMGSSWALPPSPNCVSQLCVNSHLMPSQQWHPGELPGHSFSCLHHLLDDGQRKYGPKWLGNEEGHKWLTVNLDPPFVEAISPLQNEIQKNHSHCLRVLFQNGLSG